MKWWVVSVTLRRWSVRTSVLQTARDLYAPNNPGMLRDVESHHDMEAYETSSVLNLPAEMKWTVGATLPALPGANRLICWLI